MAYSQEAIGLKVDPYSSFESIHLNPALTQQSYSNFEVTLGGIHGFGYTNYALIRKTSLLNLSSIDSDEFIYHYDEKSIPKNPSEPTIIFDTGGGMKKFSFHGEIIGPGVLFRIPNNIKIGLFTKFKAALTTFDIPENLGSYELTESLQTETINTDKASLTAMMWKEVGVHFSKRFYNVAIGINAKYLMPSVAGIARLDSELALNYQNDIVDAPMNSNLSYTENLENFDSIQSVLVAPQNGYGLGFDLGISYFSPKFSISGSLIDLGRVKINRDTKHFYIEERGTSPKLDIDEYRALSDLDGYIHKIDEDIPLIKETNQGITMGLATAISVQSDVHLTKTFGLSAALVQRAPYLFSSINRDANTLYRDNTLSIIPHYDTKWLSLAMPLILYEYEKLELGASMRVGYFTIGSDRILSLIQNRDFYGSDLYFKVSIFPLWKQKKIKTGGKLKKRKRKKYKKSKVKCYEF